MAAEEPIWSVSEVNRAIREMLENSMYPFWMKGEVSNYTAHRSGHVYLTLKDQNSQIRAVYFGGAGACRELGLGNGSLVETYGRLTVYEPRGEYQFTIRTLRPAGLGTLQQRFEELKRKLAAEGLFDAARKRPIPQLPRCIGVITSPSGAAIRDFLQIIQRRFPRIQLRIYPCAVQGENAAREVASGIEYFNRTGQAEVLVITRGGGSMEDLWPFNDEQLARTIAASRIPVISAVGHEIDFTIADFAADLRAPTPSAAAELVIQQQEELQRQLDRARKDLARGLEMALNRRRAVLQNFENRLLQHEPRRLLIRWARQLDEADTRLCRHAERKRDELRRRCELLAARLAAFDPEAQVRRGYTILRDAESGEVIRSADQPRGRKLRARLADGSLSLTVD